MSAPAGGSGAGGPSAPPRRALRVGQCAKDEAKWWAKLKETLGDAAFAALEWAPTALEVTGIVFEATGLALDVADGTVPFVSIANALVTRVRDKVDELRQVDELAAAKAGRRVRVWCSVIHKMPAMVYQAEDATFVATIDALIELARLAVKWNSKAYYKKLYWGTASKYRSDLNKAILELDVQYGALLGEAVIIALEKIDNVLASSIACIHNLPNGLPELLGREDTLEVLETALASPGSVTSLTGIAGVGKSQLAFRCAYDFVFTDDGTPREDRRLAWFLDASSEAKLVASYAGALVALTNESIEKADKDPVSGDKLSPRDLADKLLAEITRSGRSSLLVFDNVKEDEKDGGAQWLRQRYFSSLAGAANAHVLITSRSGTLRGDVEGIGRIHQVVVKTLSPEAGVALLLGDDDASEDDHAAARKIHEQLEGLALPLSVTRKFVSDKRVIEKGRFTLQGVAKGLEEAADKVEAALAAPLRFVRDGYKRSAKVLDVAAFVDPRGIPEGLLLRADASCKDEDIDLLCDLNLLQLGAPITVGMSGQTEPSYSMHHLLQAAARKEVGEEGAARRPRSAEGALAAVSGEMTSYKESDLSTWARARAAVPHAEALHAAAKEGGIADKVELAQVIGAAGTICARTLGDFVRALEAFKKALRITRAALGNDHPDVAVTRNNMGAVYQRQGRYVEALEAYEESLRIERAAFGDDHPDVAATLNNIGNVYQRQGRYVEALKAYEEALPIMRAALGDDHPDVATTLNNMGIVYQSRGRYAEALKAYDESLRIRRAALGDDHPDVAATLNNMGAVYQRQGRYVEALEAYEEALRIRRAALGDDHPDVAATLNNIGNVYASQGRYAEALEAFKKALPILRVALGNDHPTVAMTLNNMGAVYRSQGRYAEALEAYDESLRIKRAALGDDHPDVAATLNNMGLVYQGQGRYAEALEAYDESLRIKRAALGDDHPDVAATLNNMGNVYQRLRRYAEALEAFKKALPIRRAALGDDHPDVAATLNYMGAVYRDQGRYAEALEALKKALPIWRAALGDDHPDVAATLNNMGAMYQSQGRYAEALEACEESLRITRAARGDNHQNVAMAYGNMGNTFANQGRSADALEAYRKAHRIFRAVFDEDHPLVAKTRGKIEAMEELPKLASEEQQQSAAAAPSTSGSGTAAGRSEERQRAVEALSIRELKAELNALQAMPRGALERGDLEEELRAARARGGAQQQ